MNVSERLHGLDAVRGFALLLGVVLHGAVAYIAGFPGWVIADTPSAVLAVPFYVIHIFRMTLFFLLAGFFARLAVQRKGRAGFVRDRLMRVALPLGVGWLTLMPALAIVFIAAALLVNDSALPAQTANVADAQAQPSGSVLVQIVTGFPWGHLWFLYLLLCFYAFALVTRAAVDRLDRRGAVRTATDWTVAWMMRSHVAPLVLGAPVLALFLTDPEWRLWFGVPSPISGFIPHPQALVGFGVAFAFGWILHRHADLLRVWEQRWVLNTVLALAATTACLVIAGPVPIYTPAARAPITTAYAALYVLAIWTWVFAIVGAALKFLSGYGATRRYMADASYWIYLVHVPVVMAIQVAISRLPWPPEVKFLIVFTIATPICLVTYMLFVRHTVIGLVLNGRRGGTVVPAPVIASHRGAAAT